jgi:DNA transformation protein
MKARKQPASELARLMNLGPKSSEWLAAVGVRTEAELRALGSIAAYRLLALRGYPVSMNLVYAIEGALSGRHWTEIGPDEKERLKARLAEPWDGRELLEDG